VIEGNLEGRIDVMGRRGRRRKQLLDDLKEKRRYLKLKEGALNCSLWRTRCEKRLQTCRKTDYRMNEFWTCLCSFIFIQHKKCMRRIILSSVVCPVLPYTSTLSHKRRDVWENVLNIRYVFWFFLQRFSETFICVRTQRDTTINVHRSSCKVPFILVRF
jgi:hypothetical protein